MTLTVRSISLFKSKPTLTSNKIFKQWNYIKISSIFQGKKQDTLKFQQQDAITRKQNFTNGQLIKKVLKINKSNQKLSYTAKELKENLTKFT